MESPILKEPDSGNNDFVRDNIVEVDISQESSHSDLSKTFIITDGRSSFLQVDEESNPDETIADARPCCTMKLEP